jgi:pyruvate/2-oxoglutarate dehydrogenase complex dihydrolipoamide dehydrogenase (E3) component/anti-anti-sigma regulatory factor
VKDRYDYDIVVIGGGIAGFVSAVTANSLGKRVAIVEKRRTGGNCVNFTCIPSKALIRAAHARKEAVHLDRLGLDRFLIGEIDTANVLSRVRSVIQSVYSKDLPETFREIGIDVLSGAAEFVDPHRIIHECRVVSAEKFIIAVGTRPLVPPIKGLADIDYLTNENLYELDALPKSMTILGGGVAGLEYASAFGKLGIETTVVEMATRLLPMVDRELVNYLLGLLRTEGIRFLIGAKAESFAKDVDGIILTYQFGNGQTGRVKSERILASIGRRPDLDGLLLEKAGVKRTPRGIMADNTLRTSARNIYACGDIVGPYQLASMAEYQGMIAGSNASLPVKRRLDYSNNVYVIFTEPPIGYLGLTEEEARQKYSHKLKVIRFDYENMRRAMVDGTEAGVAKFLLDGSGRLAGAHILGEAATEVIHEAQVIKAFKKPLRRLYCVTHAYPTYAQGLVGRASQLAYLDSMRENILVKKCLTLFPGIENCLHLGRGRLAETERLPSIGPITGSKQYRAIEAQDDRTWLVRFRETLLDYDEEPIFEVMSGKDGKRTRSVILDFCNVTRINGLGADMLVKLCARSAMNGWTVSAFGLPDGMGDIFKVSELDQAMEIFRDEREALAAAGIAGPNPPPARCSDISPVNIGNWAKPVAALSVPGGIKGARKLNVNGLRAVGPVNGFGKLWQRIFRLYIKGETITPEQAIAALKQNFPSFQPSFNRFYPSPAGIVPGEIVLIDSMTPGGPISTGVMTLYADNLSFTFCCPQGHPESGFVTFSAHEVPGRTIVQVLGLARANDPLYEMAFRLMGSTIQGRIWVHLLGSLAAYLGVPANIVTYDLCIDQDLRWSQAKNLWYNAQIRTTLAEPVHLLKKIIGKSDDREARSGSRV